jgi:hypothetical protein
MMSTESITWSPPEPAARDGHDVVEVPLLLTAGQAAALSRASHRQGMTAGQLARRAITEFLARGEPDCPPSRGSNPLPY